MLKNIYARLTFFASSLLAVTIPAANAFLTVGVTSDATTKLPTAIEIGSNVLFAVFGTIFVTYATITIVTWGLRKIISSLRMGTPKG